MTTIRTALLAVNAATGAALVEKLVNMGLNCEMDAVALQGIKEEDLNLEYGEKVTLRAAQKQQVAQQAAAAAAGTGGGGGGAAGSSGQPPLRMATIDEFQAFRQEVEARLAISGRQGQALVTGESDSVAGQRILDTAVKRSLVSVSSGSRALAETWMAANKSVGKAWKDASQASSSLSESGEEGIQEIVTNLLEVKIKNDAFDKASIRLHDVHLSPSVCGPCWRPDIVGAAGTVLPSSTGVIIELKGQKDNYAAPANIQQIANYGVALLNQLPQSCRSSVLLGITDLKKIRFLRVERGAKGQGFSFELSEEISEVLAALCAIMLTPLTQLDAVIPPDLEYQGQPLQLTSFLGGGATSMVFQGVSTKLEGSFAVKVAKPSFEKFIPAEHKALTSLASRSCSCVPKVLGPLQGSRRLPQFLLLSPIGTPLTSNLAMGTAWFARALPRLVMDLEQCHLVGLVHCDLRPDNLLMVKGEPTRLMIVDWGFASAADLAADVYSGTIKYASERVLTLLAARESPETPIAVRPADDLVSLVKSTFALTHPEGAVRLQALESTDASGSKTLWGELLRDRPTWTKIVEDATSGNYRMVSDALARQLE